MKRMIRKWLGIEDQVAVTRAGMKIRDALAAPIKNPHAPISKDLGRPSLPPGVIPANADMAMDDGQNFDGWQRTMGGFGCGLYFPGYPYLAELAQRPEYRAPVETIAEEMTRKWITFKSTGEDDVSDKIEQIEQAFTDHKLQDKFRRLTEIDGYFGRAQLYIDIKGQEDERKVPLLIDKQTIAKGSLKAFTVIEPMWTTPVMWNAIDPTAPDFYKPSMWYVLGTATHASRLMTLISREVPDLLKPSYNFGGISLSQMLQTYVDQWLRTRDSVADLIHNFSIIALSTDMMATLADGSANVLAGGSPDTLYARAALFAQCRDNRGLMLLNKDTEELNQLAVPLSGLEGLQAQSQEHMCSVSRIPLVKAFGITPDGLNATSDGEITVFNDYIAARQELLYTAPITQALRIIQFSLFGEVDDSIVHDYLPLKELDGEALARVRKSDAEAGQIYITAGAIDPEEERERLAHDPDSPYTNLDLNKTIEPPAMQLEAQSGGDDGEEE